MKREFFVFIGFSTLPISREETRLLTAWWDLCPRLSRRQNLPANTVGVMASNFCTHGVGYWLSLKRTHTHQSRNYKGGLHRHEFSTTVAFHCSILLVCMGQHGAISNCLPRELPALRASDHLDTVGVRTLIAHHPKTALQICAQMLVRGTQVTSRIQPANAINLPGD